MSLLLGEAGGRYRLSSLRASGGQGHVYEATDEVDRRAVVVKINRLPGEAGLLARAAALRLAGLAEDPIAGPHLVPVWDLGSHEDRPFVVMERLDRTLDAPLGDDPQPLQAALALLLAADALHRAGVVHGDLKPSNVFLRDEDDGGFVALFGDLWAETGEPALSPGYSAPELWRGARPTLASDRYSLGASLLAVFAGSPPPCAVSGLRPRPPTRTELAVLPAPLRDPVARMLDPRPERRPPPAQALAALQGRPTARTGPPPTPRLLVGALLVGGLPLGLTAALALRTPAPLSTPACPPPFVASGPGCRAPDGRGLVWVPPGSFTAGTSAPEQVPWAVDAVPTPVRLSHGLWVRSTEVSQGEYRALLAEAPVATRTERLPDGREVPCASWEGHDLVDDALPVACVSWWDAVRFANLSSVADGLRPSYHLQLREDGSLSVRWDRDADGWRLPTEAEWEWAARGAGEAQAWAGAEARETICSHANVRDRSAPEAWGNEVGCADGVAVLGPVGSLEPNALGLYDMIGNVSEWTWDVYADRPDGEQIDPSGAEAGPHRVFRGGGWNQVARPVAARYADRPSGAGLNLGFRLVRSR